MNDLFDQNGDFHSDTHKPQHSQGTPVRTRRNHLCGILNELVPDIVVVVEGPNREKELKLFFRFGRDGYLGRKTQPTSGLSQCIGCAVRTDTNRFHAQHPVRFSMLRILIMVCGSIND